MDHDRARLHVTELALGQLDAALAAEVRAHVDKCNDCRSMHRFVQVLREAMRGDDRVFAEHPTADAMARFALDDPGLELPVRATIGAHLRTCVVCRNAIEAGRGRADMRLSDRIARALRGRSAAFAGLAVGAAAVAVLWITTPWPGSSGTGDPSVAVPTVRLEPTTRTRSVVPTLTVEATDLQALVVVPADPWNVRNSPDDFEIDVRVENGREPWTQRVRASRVWDGDTASVRLLLPREALPAGEVTVTLRAADDGTLIHESRFVVVER